jgi:hypothetical protein
LIKKKKKILSVKIREGFYNLITLQSYIETENDINYKIILFNIIYTLETIKTLYKNFSHNNLSLNNIFMYKKDILNDNIFTLNGISYNLPSQSHEIKITNFENSILTNTEIELLGNNVQNINTTIKNDLSFLAKEILKINKNIDLATKNFLTKLRDMKNNNIESLTDDYFNEYVKKSISEKENSSYKGSRKIKTKFDFIKLYGNNFIKQTSCSFCYI